MFRLFLPTIIRELRSLTKVTLVIHVYDGNGMMAACRLMYAMVLDMVLPIFPVSFVSCKLCSIVFEHDLNNMFYRMCEEVFATLRRYERVKGEDKDEGSTLSAYAKYRESVDKALIARHCF